MRLKPKDWYRRSIRIDATNQSSHTSHTKMDKISRRTVLEQAGLTLAVAAVGIGSVKADGFDDGQDALEDLRDSLQDFHDELELAEDGLDEIEHGSGFNGFGNPDFDGSSGDAPASEVLEDLDDDVIVNGVPANRLVPLNQTNGSNAQEFDGTVRVNGVPVAVKPPGGNTTENGGSTSTATAEGSSSSSENSSGFDGFDSGAESNSDSTGATNGFGDFGPNTGIGSQNTGDNGDNEGQSDERQRQGIEILTEVREEYDEVMETLDEIQVEGLQPIEREVRKTRQLFTDIQSQLQSAENQLANDFGVAIETIETMTDRVDTRIDSIEDILRDFDGDFGGGFDDGDFDDGDFDGGDFDDF